jgi:hypothetical protein
MFRRYPCLFGKLLNPKKQITNDKQIPMFKGKNSKHVLVIEDWKLRFICNLVLVI